MRLLVLFVFLGVIASGCRSYKRVVAPPFEEELEVEEVSSKQTGITRNTVPTATKTTSAPVVSREETVTLTHGDEMKKYNVIVGSFGNVDNAVRLRMRLINDGYKSVIMKNENNMHRVSISGFDSESAARTELARVRAEMPEFADAWLLIVKN